MAQLPSTAASIAPRYDEGRLFSGTTEKAMKINIKELGPAFTLVVLALAFSILSAQFFSMSNVQAILESAAIPVVLAVGITFIIVQGSIDLSIEGVMAASSMAVALLIANSITTFDYGWLAIAAGPVFGLAFGLSNGLLYTYLRLPSLIVTLATWFIGLGVATLLFPGRQPEILDGRITMLAIYKPFGLSFLVCIAFVVATIGVVLQNYSQFGRMSFAIGIDEKTTRLSGNSVRLHKILAFSFMGVLAGMGGAMISAQLAVGNPSAGQGFLFPTISAAVIGGTLLSGGKGGVLHSVNGVLILEVLRNGMVQLGVDPYLRHVVEGIIIIAALVVGNWQLRARTRVVK
ncbi:putative Ribose/xylose/arabinose/galactoside ABC-type transport system, permease components AraH (plasmid) [Sinorhizobium fredii NGR234]|uniref:Ribose/xylose/arabinose/galactoside ABC-type transport system, permease components AraH n=1 Tax=Sinorhizobium fredii (strain NBRC 101917 / NGR234) TaxID=394 RepID=C3KP93_SINFN|nr:ABC transporter permease [Sinorhizobium fredii]ACP21901.1 putative Ribose/xylose/arabinose/galactoside ABC-type transport system, permease components AraH [Sinorhizobium fredii NGR234]